MVHWSLSSGLFLIGLQRASSARPPSTLYSIDNSKDTSASNSKRDKAKKRAASSATTTTDGSCEADGLNLDLFPDEWETYTYSDIRDHFDCGYRSGDNEKPLPSMEDWQLMRTTYTKVVDNTKKWNDPVPPTKGYSFDRNKLGTPPPYYAKFSPGKGRGLFATRDIPKGEVVHDGTHSDVIFPTAMDWRKFVFSLPENLACDCTDWHWMQQLETGGTFHFVAGINISSLMNSGGEEYGGVPNALPKTSTSNKFYALRDIRDGEEILTDYYVYDTDFGKVGL